MIYHFELFDSGGAGRQLSLDNITSEHASLAETIAEAKSITSRVAGPRGKPEIGIIRDEDGNVISEIGVDKPRP